LSRFILPLFLSFVSLHFLSSTLLSPSIWLSLFFLSVTSLVNYLSLFIIFPILLALYLSSYLRFSPLSVFLFL
jgi:hypothetical protein